MKSIKRRDLARTVADQLGLAAIDIYAIQSLTFDAIRKYVDEGNTVSIRHFATFSAVECKKKFARNIAKGAVVPLKPHKRPKAKMSKEWIAEMRKNTEE